MSRWLITSAYDAHIIFDLIDKKIKKEDPNFLEALRTAIEYEGIENAQHWVIDSVATQEDVDNVIDEIKKSYGYKYE